MLACDIVFGITQPHRKLKKHERKKRIADSQVGIQNRETGEKKKIKGEKNCIRHKQEEVKESVFLSTCLFIPLLLFL